MDYSEVEKAQVLTINKFIEYVPKSVVFKTIIKKTTGNITTAAYDTDEVSAENTTQFDTYIQVIDGKAEILIDGTSNLLNAGQSIIIPAHSSSIIMATERFKMISTIIKNGYE